MMTVKEEMKREHYGYMTTFEFCMKCAKDARENGNKKHYEFYMKMAKEASMKMEILEKCMYHNSEVA